MPGNIKFQHATIVGIAHTGQSIGVSIAGGTIIGEISVLLFELRHLLPILSGIAPSDDPHLPIPDNRTCRLHRWHKQGSPLMVTPVPASAVCNSVAVYPVVTSN